MQSDSINTPPRLRAIILCDAVAVDPASGKVTVLGMFDNVTAFAYPLVIPGAIVLIVSDVRSPLDVLVETVAYPPDKPIGERVVIGTVHLEPPPIGHTVTAFIPGALVFPVTGPGVADVFVHGNGQYLGHRSIPIAELQGGKK